MPNNTGTQPSAKHYPSGIPRYTQPNHTSSAVTTETPVVPVDLAKTFQLPGSSASTPANTMGQTPSISITVSGSLPDIWANLSDNQKKVALGIAAVAGIVAIGTLAYYLTKDKAAKNAVVPATQPSAVNPYQNKVVDREEDGWYVPGTETTGDKPTPTGDDFTFVGLTAAQRVEMQLRAKTAAQTSTGTARR